MRQLAKQVPNFVNLCAISATVCLIGVGLSGCSAPSPPDPMEGVADIVIEGLAFLPREITIRQGETVRWTNLESVSVIPHTVTSGNRGEADAGSIFDSGNLNSVYSFTQRFDEAGSFVYYCRIHPFLPAMRDAIINVEP